MPTPSPDAASGKDRRKEVSGQLRTGNSPGSYTPHAATSRVWRLTPHLWFGGLVITIEPWSWRGIRQRAASEPKATVKTKPGETTVTVDFRGGAA